MVGFFGLRSGFLLVVSEEVSPLSPDHALAQDVLVPGSVLKRRRRAWFGEAMVQLTSTMSPPLQWYHGWFFPG